MRTIYSILLYLLVPAALLRMLWRSRRDPAYRRRWPERFGFVAQRRDDAPLIWLHAVSAGEAQAARPLLEEIARRRPGCPIMVTTTTPSGASIVEGMRTPSVRHCCFPYDLPDAVARFLRRTRPRVLILMETELWPNMLHCCARNGVPVLLANARLSSGSLRGYRRFPAVLREMLDTVSLVAAQSQADAERFLELGVERSTLAVTGNLKFDLRLPDRVVQRSQAIRRNLGTARPTWIAASTHPGEEEVVLQAFMRIGATYPECLLILVPRHPERAAQLGGLCRSFGLVWKRGAASACCEASDQVFVVDSMGELPLFYAAADIAFVGGSLVPVGGHNVLEPAACGVPTMVGPFTQNFSEIVALLEAAGATLRVADGAELAERACALLGDAELRMRIGECARSAVEQHRGAVGRVVELAERFLPR